MPKLTRKYPTDKKTTTPEGYREYKKLQMREYRKRKREEYLLLKSKVAEALKATESVTIYQGTMPLHSREIKALNANETAGSHKALKRTAEEINHFITECKSELEQQLNSFLQPLLANQDKNNSYMQLINEFRNEKLNMAEQQLKKTVEHLIAEVLEGKKPETSNSILKKLYESFSVDCLRSELDKLQASTGKQSKQANDNSLQT